MADDPVTTTAAGIPYEGTECTAEEAVEAVRAVRATATRTVRVHLADAPTDVLVWLVEQPSHLWWSVERITAATAPDDAHDAQATVANALSLLRQMGYVVRSSEVPAWAATVEGQNAVKEAKS